MAVTRQGDLRKNSRKHSGRRRGGIKEIVIGGESDKEQEVIVRHEGIPQRKASSVWSWHEEFEIAWYESLITKGGK